MVIAVLLMSENAYAGSCFNYAQECTNSEICYYSVQKGSAEWETHQAWKGHIKEAKQRGLSCGVKVSKSGVLLPLKIAFVSLSLKNRKLLQANLKELGYYASTIDGLYGKGTSGALTAYNKEQLGNTDLKVSTNVSALVEALLALNNAEEVAPETITVEETTITEAEAELDAEPEVEVTELEPEVETPENYQAGIDAYNSGDFKTAVEQAKLLAPLGNADAQFYLGKMYAEGKGTLQRNTHAHMWFNLASANGHSEAAQERDTLTEKMNPSLVDKAQDLAAACMDSDYQDCSLGNKSEINNQNKFNIKYAENDKAVIEASFREETLLKRKQIQYALRKMGYYLSSVDGLWGKGTEIAVVNFGQDSKLRASNPTQIFAYALSKVDVPSSFIVAESKKKPKKKVNNNRNRLRSIVDMPSITADQAVAICKPQAEAAGNQARRSYRPSNTRFSGSCRRDYFGNYNCSGGNSLSGGKWGGMLATLETGNASAAASNAVLTSCLAGFGWKI